MYKFSVCMYTWIVITLSLNKRKWFSHPQLLLHAKSKGGRGDLESFQPQCLCLNKTCIDIIYYVLNALKIPLLFTDTWQRGQDWVKCLTSSLRSNTWTLNQVSWHSHFKSSNIFRGFFGGRSWFWRFQIMVKGQAQGHAWNITFSQ